MTFRSQDQCSGAPIDPAREQGCDAWRQRWLLATMLAACGQKGPLTLAAPAPSIERASAAAAPR